MTIRLLIAGLFIPILCSSCALVQLPARAVGYALAPLAEHEAELPLPAKEQPLGGEAATPGIIDSGFEAMMALRQSEIVPTHSR